MNGIAAMRQQVGNLIHAEKLPQPGQPRSSHYEGDGWIVVRHPETKGVVAAMKSILESVKIV